LVDASANPNSCGATLTTSDGTYVLDPNTGIVTFTASPSAAAGVRPAVTYRVTDTFGQTAQSTLTPTIYQRPTATAKNGLDLVDQLQSFDIIAGATKDPATTLTASNAALCAGNETAPNCSVSSVTITGKGVFTLDPASGVVTFTPDQGFVGAVPAITYVLTDGLGQQVSQTITVTVVGLPTPTANDDTATGDVGSPLSFTPATNDNPGVAGISSVQNLQLNVVTIRLCDVAPNAQNPPNCTASTVTTADGTYVLDTTTGSVTFTGANGFVGPATTPVRYQISNSYTVNGTAGSATTSALLTPTLTDPAASPTPPTVVPMPLPFPFLPPPESSEPANPPAAVATDDTVAGRPGETLTFRPSINDVANSSEDITIEPTSIGLCGEGMAPPDCTATALTTPDGRYSIDPTSGNVRFEPAPGFTGQARFPVRYQIWYQQGTGDSRRRLFAAAYLRPIISPTLPTTGAGVPWLPATAVMILGCLITALTERRVRKLR
jgi:CshA-type fibril repeat protein